jgi:hypothetical protein
MSREKKGFDICINNKAHKQVNSIRYLGIIFDSNYIEGIFTKLLFSMAKSAKITWGLKHKALKTIYTAAILPLLLYGVLVWIVMLKSSS